MRRRQATALRRLAVVASGLGIGAVLLPGLGARSLGMPAQPRTLWAIRLFGIRELCLAYGLARAASSGDRGQGRLMADIIAAAQIGDGLLAGVLLARGTLSRRVALAIWTGVPPTLMAARAAGARE